MKQWKRALESGFGVKDIALLGRYKFNYDEITNLWSLTRRGKTLHASLNSNRQFVITNITDGKTSVEHTIAPYQARKTTEGTFGILQAHHPLQDKWGKDRLGNYGYKQDNPPSVVLLDSLFDSPHQIITARQNARRGTTSTRTYLQERSLTMEDLRAASVPENVIDNALQQVDSYYRNLWTGITDQNVRDDIFGDVAANLGW